MSRITKSVRFFLLAVVSLFCLSGFADLKERIRVTELFRDRVRVLYLDERGPQNCYLQLDFLERHTDLRFIYQRTSEGGGAEKDAAVADGLLWDDGATLVTAAKRTVRVNHILESGDFDLIVLDNKKFAKETQDLLVRYVKEGGYLVWLGSAIVKEGALAEICPFTEGSATSTPKEKIEAVSAGHPLAHGFPLSAMFAGRIPAGKFKEGVEVLVRSVPSGQGLMGIMKAGKGTVLALNTSGMAPPDHQPGDDQLADTDFLWAQFWQQAGQYCKQKGKLLPSYMRLATAEKNIPAGEDATVSVHICHNSGDFPHMARLELTDNSGTVPCITKDIVLKAGESEITAQLPAPEYMPSGRYLLTGALLDKKMAVIHKAYAGLPVKGRIETQLTTDRDGYAIGAAVKITAAVKSSADTNLKAELVVNDAMNVPVLYEKKEAKVSATNEIALVFNWTMPDYGVEGWVFCANVVLKNGQGKTIGEAKRWFWRYQPWTMREKFLFSNYWAGQGNIPASMMPLFALYHRGIGFNAGHTWREPYYSRFNMRAWYQWSATMMENFTGDFNKPDFSHLEKDAEAAFNRDLKTAAYVIQDFGEETGFYNDWSNNPFGEPLSGEAKPDRKWRKDEQIPPGAHRLFQLYLKEKYGTVEKLNAAWEKQFVNFEDAKLSCKNGLPSGWLTEPPPKDVPENIAPYIDTHGFFFWYTRQTAQTITRALQAKNPVSDWSMSFSLTFNQYSPVPMTFIHPVYIAQLLPAWHARAQQRSRNGNTPFFSFHWGFDEDYRGWAQFWHHNLAALATFQCNWGSMFNYNLTPSRSTLLFKRLMAKVRPREKFFLDCYPSDNYEVGIYHPTLDWEQVFSRPNFFLKAQGPEAAVMGQLGYKSTGASWLGGPEWQIYNVLSASGYTPRFVAEEEITRCKVLFVPYVETLPESAAAEMKKFVSGGGLLVTMPVTGTHNGYGRPYEVVPGGGLDEVLGIKLGREIIGQRSVIILPRLTGPENPILFDYIRRIGGEPPYLWVFGHQAVKSVESDVKVPVKLYDGNPAITIRAYGRGKAVHLNMLTFDHFSQYEFSHFQNESLRQLLDNLVRHTGVTPCLCVERPWLAGIGVNEWAQYQYCLKDSNIRVLALYSDKLNGRIIGEVVLTAPVMEVFDILKGEKAPVCFRVGGDTITEVDPFSFEKAKRAGSSTGFTFPVELNAGDVAFYAMVPYHRTCPKNRKFGKMITEGGRLGKELL